MLLIQYTLIYASVLIFVAFGGMFSERSGVINLGLEGIMVMGALGGAFVLYSLPVGTPAIVIILLTILASVLFGMLYSLFLAVAAINFKADQTLVGTAMNMLATAAAVVIVKSFNNARSNGTNPSAILDYIANRLVEIETMDGKEFYEIVKGEQHCKELSDSAGKKSEKKTEKSDSETAAKEKKTR